MLATGDVYQLKTQIPQKKKKRTGTNMNSVRSGSEKKMISQEPSLTQLPQLAKDTAALRRDVQAQLDMLRNKKNETNATRSILVDQDPHDLTQNVLNRNFLLIDQDQQFERLHTEQSPVTKRRKTKPRITLLSQNGPVHLLNVNRGSSGMTHRTVNKNVRNTRDVLNVKDFKTDEKLNSYKSPSQKPVRVTSAVGKRSLSALKNRYQDRNVALQYANFPPSVYNSIPERSRQPVSMSALATIQNVLNKFSGKSQGKSEAKLKFSKDLSGQSRIVDTGLGALYLDGGIEMSIASRSGAATSVNQSTTMGGKRRVHTEGLKMLDEHYTIQEEKIRLKNMENRIMRLEFEEQRSRKMEEQANKRADSMMNARKRHFEELMLKKNWYLNREQVESQQREANLRRKAERSFTIQQRRLDAMSANKQAKVEIKEQIKSVKTQESMRQMSEIEQKKVQKLHELIRRNKVKQTREIATVEKQITSGAAYSVRQEQNSSVKEEYRSRIQQLEEKESRLIDQLKVTTNRQRSAYLNLEQVVNQGYEYYFQAHSEKRTIQERRAKNQSIFVEQKKGSLGSINQMPILANSVDASVRNDAPPGTKLRQLFDNQMNNQSTQELQQPYANSGFEITSNQLNDAERKTLRAQARMELIQGRKPSKQTPKRNQF